MQHKIFLGIVAHTLGYGDACAALMIDGQIKEVIEEERLSRLRYDDTFPGQAIKALLRNQGVNGSDVDEVVLHIHPLRGIGNRLFWLLRHARETIPNASAYLKLMRRYSSLGNQMELLLGRRVPLAYAPHHLCHAAAAFYASGKERGAFLTLDGAGEGLTGSFGVAHVENGLTLLHKIPYPHSLGLFYSAICSHLGFPPPAGPGKVMGLAAYGDPQPYMPLMRKMIYLDGENLRLDLDMFSFHRNLVTPLSSLPWLSHHFVEASGLPPRSREAEIEREHMDLAAAMQARTNEIGLELAKIIARTTGEKRLFLGGGVALNSVMNGAIAEAGIFDEIYIHPMPGDAGNAIGSLYLHALKNGVAVQKMDCLPYCGPEYPPEEMAAALDHAGVVFQKIDNAPMEAAQAVIAGKIVGWFQGRMEIGPRALGNRSILADPKVPNMKDIINTRVKHREWFRPFAPSVAHEAYRTYFEGDPDNPYMLRVDWVRKKWREVFPSITHVDGTAGVQSVSADTNPLYHQLLQYIGQQSGHPMVLNTSFNDREPIVCSPHDAVQCFVGTDIDVLVMGNYLARKA